jgi:hypothetical protein
MTRILWLAPLFSLAACTSAPPPAKEPAPAFSGPAATSSKHPWAKFIELAGFRLNEAGPGNLRIRFIALNHSEADMSEMTVHVRLITSVSKPDDPPIAEFDAKVPPLGPLEIRDVTTTISSKVRAYEFPDWQFLRADFDITAPTP